MTFGRHYRLMEKEDDETRGGGGGDDDELNSANRGDELDFDGGGGADDDAAAAAAKKAAASEAADEGAKAEKKAALTIPKSRFDEAVKKERDAREVAEAKAKELEGMLAKQDSGLDMKAALGEIDALEEELEAQMAEGTPEKRRELRKQIREKQEVISDAKANARATQATAIAIEQIRYDAVVAKMEQDYTFLNPDDSENFDGDIAAELVELKSAYEALGMASSQALTKATKTLKTQLDVARKALEKPGEGDEQDEDELTPEQKAAAAEEKAKAAVKAAADSASSKTAEAKAAKRREEAVAKGLEAKEKQPAAAAGGKADKDVKEVKVSTLTDKQLDDMPEAELQRLRGDRV